MYPTSSVFPEQHQSRGSPFILTVGPAGFVSDVGLLERLMSGELIGSPGSKKVDRRMTSLAPASITLPTIRGSAEGLCYGVG